MKFLINPFFYLLFLQLILLLTFLRAQLGNPWRKRLHGLFLTTLLFVIFSTSLVERVLLSSLSVPKSELLLEPQFIFVLGGGYLPGIIPEEDVLGTESQRRVLHAVTVWKHYPAAQLVFQGAEFVPQRRPERSVQLMAELAQSRGVPASAVSIEAISRNTREHPLEALKLTGIQAQTPVMLVTSSWHMKRALQEFRRYFQTVYVDPVPEAAQPLTWQDFIPGAGALATNTTLLCEWVGMLWYGLLNVAN